MSEPRKDSPTEDPRPDRHDREHKSPEAGKSGSYPAPGGVGTGTKDAPKGEK